MNNHNIYNNIIRYTHNDYIELQVYDTKYGIFKIVLIDIDDYKNFFQNKKIRFGGRGDRRYPFCGTNLVHRIIMGCTTNDGKMIDHINGNPLDARKSNLRIVSQSINERNLTRFNRNNTGVIGIQKRQNGTYLYYRVSWRNLDGKRRTKQFNINKLGDEKAFQMAKEFLKQQHEKYGYITNFE